VFGAPLPITTFSQKRCGETLNRPPAYRLPVLPPHHHVCPPAAMSRHCVPSTSPTTSPCHVIHLYLHVIRPYHDVIHRYLHVIRPYHDVIHPYPGPADDVMLTSSLKHAKRPFCPNFVFKAPVPILKKIRRLCYYLPSVPVVLKLKVKEHSKSISKAADLSEKISHSRRGPSVSARNH